MTTSTTALYDNITNIADMLQPLHNISGTLSPFDNVSDIMSPFDNVSDIMSPFDNVSDIMSPFDNVSDIMSPFDNVSDIMSPFDNVSDIMSPFDNVSDTLMPFNNMSAGSPVPLSITTVLRTVCMGLVAVIIFTGNILVLITVLKRTDLQTPSNIYIFNLAITDILTGVSSVLMIVQTYFPHLVDSAVICPVLRLGTVVYTMMMSVFLMTGVAVDRLIAVYNPLNYHNVVTPTKTICVIVLIWLYTFLISYLPSILGYHHWAQGEACYLAKIFHRNAIFNLLGHFYAASLVIIVAYASLFKIASHHMRQIAAMEIQGQSASQFQRQLKASKTLLIVIGAFALCWWPYTFNLINLVLSDPGNPNSTAKKVSNVLIMPLFLNSGINPIIYARKLPGFKREFIRILTCNRHNGVNELNSVGTEMQLN